MIPWELLATAPIPKEGGHLQLHRRGDEFQISIQEGGVLMNTRAHGSEDALAELACGRVANRPNARVLIGGLGMGFTLAEALRQIGPDAEAVVAELVPAVVQWNHGPLGAAAGNPLQDVRASVHQGDVGKLLRKQRKAYDAIMLDVDNGPEGLTHEYNNWLYTVEGLTASYQALRPSGLLAVWSAGPDKTFNARLRKVGFTVEETRVRARRTKGQFHTIWLAQCGPE